MPEKYTVVPCANCKNVKLVKGRPTTTRCGRCGTRFSFKETRKMYSTEDSDEAREARTVLQARRNNLEDEYDSVKEEIAEISVEDILDSNTKRSLNDVSRDAKQNTDTREEFIEYIAREGYSEKQAENMFKHFRDQGEIYKCSDGTFGTV